MRLHIKSAGIELKEKNFNKFEQVLNKNMQNSNNNFSKMQPKDFDLLVMPTKSEEEEYSTNKSKNAK